MNLPNSLGFLFMVDKTQVEELQKIVKDSYGEDLTYQEVSEIANTMVRHFDLLAKIYHEMQKNK